MKLHEDKYSFLNIIGLIHEAQKSIRRFSEDIDLETATKKYTSLPRTARKDLEDDRKGSITAVWICKGGRNIFYCQ